jgi:hypothetical protein
MCKENVPSLVHDDCAEYHTIVIFEMFVDVILTGDKA